MASNLPAVINNNNQLADTLRSLFMPNSNSQHQIMMLKRIFGNNYNQKQVMNNNGAEDFFMKGSMTELHGRLEKIQQTMENINDNIKSMVEIEDEINDREEDDFYKEQREEAAAQREVKQISVLEKILKQIGNSSLGFLNSDLSNTFDENSSMFGGGAGLLAALGMGGIGSKIAGSGITSFLLSGMKKLGVAGLAVASVYSAFDAKRISGSNDITGISGMGKILGSSLAGLFSAFTFGIVDSKDIYNFMTTSIPKGANFVYEKMKAAATDVITILDSDLQKWLGNNYSITKDALGKKLTNIKNLSQNIASKAFSLMIGGANTVYDYGLDLINWFEGNQAPELGGKNYLPSSESTKATGIIGKTVGMAKDVTGLVTGQTEKNIGAANKLGLTAQWRAADPNVEKSTRYCYRGVKRTLLEAGLVDHLLPGTHAYEAAEQFEKLGWEEIGGKGWKTDNPSIVKSLPPGYLVVWNKDPKKADDSGHVAITTGNDMEFSDHEQSLDSSIRKRGKFGYRIFAPYKPLMQGISDSADSWVYNKVKSIGSSMWSNLTSFGSGEQDALSQSLAGMRKDLSSLDTVSVEDTKAKGVISEVNQAQQVTASKSEPIVSAPSVNVVNNSSTVIPQDVSTSSVPIEIVYKNSRLPNRKF